MTELVALHAAVASHGLPTRHQLPLAPVSDEAWAQLLAELRAARLDGHLLAAIRDGAIATTAEQRRTAHRQVRAAQAGALLLQARTIATYDLLASRGIDVRILKGFAVANTAFADPSARLFADVDVLVPSDSFDDAATVLLASGYQRTWPELRLGFDRRYGKSVLFVAPDGLEVDVHRTFVKGPFGLLIDLDDLFRERPCISLSSRPLAILGRTPRFLHACYNAALGNVPPKLAALRDVAQIVLHDPPDLDAVVGTAHRWQGEAVVARALRLAWHELGVLPTVPLVAWAHAHTASSQDRARLRPYLRARTRYAVTALATVPVIPGAVGKARFLAATLVPSRASLDSRGSSRLRWIAGLRRGPDGVRRLGDP